MKFVRALVPLCVLAMTSCSHGAAVTPVTLPGAPSAALGVGPNTLHVIPFFQFRDGPDGYTPLGTRGGRRGLVGSVTAMYGSTPAGGDTSCAAGNGKGCGVIYELTRGKNTYKEIVLLKFTGPNGAVPYASISIDPSGNLYGTTYYGGVHNAGTVFKLQSSVSGYTPSVVYSFRGGKNDGAHPFAGLIEVGGKLYGTTIGGGKYKNDLCKVQGGSPDGRCGTAYSIDLTTGNEKVLHSFGAGGDGANPYAGLINEGGTLYGTTALGGNSTDCGTIYSINSTTGDELVLYSFGGPDGCNPYSGLVARGDWLYGTTCCGGEDLGPTREGVVFKLNASSHIEQVLHKFGKAIGPDGSEPEAALRYAEGMFYGTTSHGGRLSRCADGCGTIFRIDPSSGTQYESLHAFYGGVGGGNPTDRLLYTGGAFYGTTSTGGAKGFGTGFRATP